PTRTLVPYTTLFRSDLDLGWNRLEVREPNPLAEAVLHAKRAAKWNESYIGSFLTLRDENDRIHPRIGGLQARTARMSVSTPPLQDRKSTRLNSSHVK